MLLENVVKFIGWPYLVIAGIGLAMGFFRQLRMPSLRFTREYSVSYPIMILVLTPYIVFYGCTFNNVCIYSTEIFGKISDTAGMILGLIILSGVPLALAASFWFFLGSLIGVWTMNFAQGED